jgi:hypothetical protein
MIVAKANMAIVEAVTIKVTSTITNCLTFDKIANEWQHHYINL